MSARPLFKVDRDRRISDLRKQLLEERRLRLAAEANARRFHALLLEARIAALPTRTEEP